uniref:THAP domain-containing protein 1 n=1 Tax=Astyanax mexicanus TaxID=7994 RepID=A0A3B1IMF5_ASTMX
MALWWKDRPPYNKWSKKSEIFHKFPVDAAVRAKWLTKIRRDKFTPTVNTRVCGRHFQPGDFAVTAGGLRRLQSGAVPLLFSWNEYTLPTPRQNSNMNIVTF